MKNLTLILVLYFIASSQTCNKKATPACITKMTEGTSFERPQRIDAYDYQGKRVYYVMEECCDKFNPVYDQDCNVICSPSGGITGKGDGKCPAFDSEAKWIETVWEKK